VAKTTASVSFVALGWLRWSPGDTFGAWLVVGLVLSLAGDLLLLRRRTFPAGLGAFLAAHLAFIVAFHSALPAGEWPLFLAAPVLAASVLAAAWLWPHLGAMRPAVLAYIAVITVMVWGGAAVTTAGAKPPLLLAGAALFFASDLAVARNRFVRESFANRAWGLPAYYAAQLALALTIAT
jgi:uncharacterized membrane protein YhhN